MRTSPQSRAPVANRLLAALPAKEYQRLLPSLELTTLVFAETLYEEGAPIQHVYFPMTSVVSLLAAVEDRATLAIAIVGSEGMVGLSVFMGVKTARNRAVVQSAGLAVRMKAAALRAECRHDGLLPHLLQRYTYALLTQASQSAACHRFHLLEARLARWLLATHDRLGANEFQLTQSFLSNMLGVRREGINKAAGSLQRQHLINYSRGHLMIVNRAGLAAVACGCYAIIKEKSASMLG